MQVIFASTHPHGGYKKMMRDRSAFQYDFADRILAEPCLAGGRVLDIGCGADLPWPLAELKGLYGQLDGVDPDPAALKHPLLKKCWNIPFEETDIPQGVYDLAYSYNVVEHIADARPFLRKVRTVLKDGGVFWALTANANHPFTWFSRIVQLTRMKPFMRESLRNSNGIYNVNEYPAYYRMNRAGKVLKVIEELGFSKATFCYHPCMQWDTYFPEFLQWLPHLYDFLIGIRFRPCMLVFSFRLQV